VEAPYLWRPWATTQFEALRQPEHWPVWELTVGRRRGWVRLPVHYSSWSGPCRRSAVRPPPRLHHTTCDSPHSARPSAAAPSPACAAVLPQIHTWRRSVETNTATCTLQYSAFRLFHKLSTPVCTLRARLVSLLQASWTTWLRIVWSYNTNTLTPV